MNCLICRRFMDNTFGSIYECKYCGHVEILKANQVTLGGELGVLPSGLQGGAPTPIPAKHGHVNGS